MLKITVHLRSLFCVHPGHCPWNGQGEAAAAQHEKLAIRTIFSFAIGCFGGTWVKALFSLCIATERLGLWNYTEQVYSMCQVVAEPRSTDQAYGHAADMSRGPLCLTPSCMLKITVHLRSLFCVHPGHCPWNGQGEAAAAQHEKLAIRTIFSFAIGCFGGTWVKALFSLCIATERLGLWNYTEQVYSMCQVVAEPRSTDQAYGHAADMVN
nr:hypothetical protein CFP56_58754 [Quercus suber]